MPSHGHLTCPFPNLYVPRTPEAGREGTEAQAPSAQLAPPMPCPCQRVTQRWCVTIRDRVSNRYDESAHVDFGTGPPTGGRGPNQRSWLFWLSPAGHEGSPSEAAQSVGTGQQGCPFEMPRSFCLLQSRPSFSSQKPLPPAHTTDLVSRVSLAEPTPGTFLLRVCSSSRLGCCISLPVAVLPPLASSPPFSIFIAGITKIHRIGVFHRIKR